MVPTMGPAGRGLVNRRNTSDTAIIRLTNLDTTIPGHQRRGSVINVLEWFAIVDVVSTDHLPAEDQHEQGEIEGAREGLHAGHPINGPPCLGEQSLLLQIQ